jgi:predicted ATPase
VCNASLVTRTTRHLERYQWAPPRGSTVDLGTWPFTLPAVRQVIDAGGLDIPRGVTVLVGENGAGKSTLVEAFAAAYPRFGAETSSAMSVLGPGLVGDESNLHRYLKAKTHPLAATGGFFLRAEAMHNYLRAIDSSPAERRAWGHEKVSERSHGESFLAVLRHRFVDQGVYFLDEPESALSFRSSLTLLALLDTMRAEGSQIILATHSPLLASLPGATIFELGDWGIRPTPWEELELVDSWRDYLRAPERWLRHLTADPG